MSPNTRYSMKLRNILHSDHNQNIENSKSKMRGGGVVSRHKSGNQHSTYPSGQVAVTAGHIRQGLCATHRVHFRKGVGMNSPFGACSRSAQLSGGVLCHKSHSEVADGSIMLEDEVDLNVRAHKRRRDLEVSKLRHKFVDEIREMGFSRP
jgi:hypothetical protein